MLAFAGTAAAAEPALPDCAWKDVVVVDRRVAPAAGAELHRPWFDFVAEEGSFYALEACGQRVGVLFRGLGSATVRTPGPERSHTLHQEFDNLPGTLDVEHALFVASDGAIDELLAGLPAGVDGPFVDGPVPPPVYALAQRRLAAFDPLKFSGGTARPSGEILWAPERSLGGVWADLELLGLKQRRRGDNLEIRSAWVTYRWSDRGGFGGPERGRWLRRSVGSAVGRDFGTLPTEAAVGEAGSPFGLDDDPRPWNLEHAAVSIFVDPTYGTDRNLDGLEGSATLTLTAAPGAGRWVLLRLAEGQTQVYGAPWVPVEVTGGGAAIGDAEMAEAPVARVGDAVWVQLPADVAPGESARLLVRWRAKVLEPSSLDSIRPLAGWTWYPQVPVLDRHALEIRLAAPRFWKAAATGRLMELSDDGRYATRLFREKRGVVRGGLYLLDSRLKEVRPPEPGLPVLRIHRSNNTVGVEANIADEVYTHLRNLSELLGPFPYAELELVERGGGATNVPGVIPLVRFDSPPNQVVTTRVNGEHSLLAALARQWIEADLGAWSVHDRWAVEGLAALAECFALTDIDMPGRCNGQMGERRRRWRDSLQISGQRWLAGPLWSAGASGWQLENEWFRAPLVLQALRLQVGEEPMRSILGRITRAYGGQSLRSESLVVQAQAATGIDLRRFFYGWVYATPHDPVARLNWSNEPAADGTHTLAISARLDDGRDADPLPLELPLLVRFDVAGEPRFQRLQVTDEQRVFRITGLPSPPERVEADPLKHFFGRVEVVAD